MRTNHRTTSGHGRCRLTALHFPSGAGSGAAIDVHGSSPRCLHAATPTLTMSWKYSVFTIMSPGLR
jgi:hypothetical protein